MASTVSKVKPKTAAEQKVNFEFYAPLAQEVLIAADFNGWNPEKTPLKKNKDGKWKTTVSLPSGRYEYRFRVDGDWQNDQRTVECVPNPYGSWNCVLQIQ